MSAQTHDVNHTTTMNTMTPECNITNNLPAGEVLFPPETLTTSIDSLDDIHGSVVGLDNILDYGGVVVPLNQSATFESYVEDENVTASNENRKCYLLLAMVL